MKMFLSWSSFRLLTVVLCTSSSSLRATARRQAWFWAARLALRALREAFRTRRETTVRRCRQLVSSLQTIKATSQLGDPRVTYNLEDGMVPETNMPVRFYLSPNREDGSASILVSEPLDYETTAFFYLRVRAQNVAAVPLAAFTTVYINVTGGVSAARSNCLFCSLMCFLDTTVQGMF